MKFLKYMIGVLAVVTLTEILLIHFGINPISLKGFGISVSSVLIFASLYYSGD